LTQSPSSVLIVDDELAVRTALRVNLKKAGFRVLLAETAEEGFELLQVEQVDLVLSDVKMPGAGGLELLQSIRTHWPQLPVIMMTGHGSVEDAVSAIKTGAADYIIKPISRDELLVILERTLRSKALEAEVEHLRAELAGRYGFENLIGVTPAMQEVYELVAAVAESDALVLLTGPTGTGKELLANAIHYRSQRRHGPFISVNCGALPEGLLESELFGHEKGAFTSAVRARKGRFEQARGGTILLDEIGEIPLATQVRLLRVLESGEIQRVGRDRPLKVDVRIIAATNRDLRDEVRSGSFREDLFYRLNVFHIPVPSLKERKEDIPLLVDHFVAKYADRYNKSVRRVAPAILDRLMAHDWPGNVRELEHALERAIILCRGTALTELKLETGGLSSAAPVPTTNITLQPGQGIAEALLSLERDLIIRALQETRGVQARAARKLGISRSNLHYRIKKLGLDLDQLIYGKAQRDSV
jgi:DNA-binding NtrC family response regulator